MKSVRSTRPISRRATASSCWRGNNFGSGTLSVHFPHDGPRSLDTRAVPPTGRIQSPRARRSWSWASPRIASTHRSRPHRHGPVPVSTRPSPPCAKATRWSCRNSNGWQGPSRMRASADRLRERGVKTGPRPGALRPGRSDGKDVLQYPRHLRRVRSRSHPHAHPRGYGHRPRKGEIARQPATRTVRQTAAVILPHAYRGRVFPSAILPSSSPTQDQPSIVHSTGTFPLSVRYCPLPESTPS